MKNPILISCVLLLFTVLFSCTDPEPSEEIIPLDLQDGDVYFIYNEIISTPFGLNGKDDYRVSIMKETEYKATRAEGFPFELNYHNPLEKVHDFYFQKDRQSDDIRVIDKSLENILFRINIQDAQFIHPVNNNRVVISNETEIFIYDLNTLEFERYEMGEYSIIELVQMEQNLVLILQCEDSPCNVERQLARLNLDTGEWLFSDIEVGFQLINNDGQILVSSIIQYDVDLLEIDPSTLDIIRTFSTDITQTKNKSTLIQVDHLLYFHVDDWLYVADKDALKFELIETPEGLIDRIIYSTSREEFVMYIKRRKNGLRIDGEMIFMNKLHEVVKATKPQSNFIRLEVFED